MVGDLSRHINRSTSTEESGYYAKRNEKFLKLQEVNFQTILINNWTQGAVEQHFGDMKHNYFNNGRLDRLDDFAYDYHRSIILQEKQFAEFYLNTKKQKRKHPKSTNSKHELSPKKRRTSKLTVSKFRIHNARSFYSSPLCTRKLKFKSGPEFSGNLKNAEVLCQQRQACVDLFFILESSIDIAWACWLPSFGIKCLSTSQIYWKKF